MNFPIWPADAIAETDAYDVVCAPFPRFDIEGSSSKSILLRMLSREKGTGQGRTHARARIAAAACGRWKVSGRRAASFLPSLFPPSIFHRRLTRLKSDIKSRHAHGTPSFSHAFPGRANDFGLDRARGVVSYGRDDGGILPYEVADFLSLIRGNHALALVP